jgi:hypothetical protein
LKLKSCCFSLWPEAKLLHLHGLRLLPAALLLLLFLVAVLAVIEDFAYRGIGVRRNLDEVKLVFASPVEGFLNRNNIVLAVRFDNANLVGTNFLIYAKFVYVSDN